MEFPTLTKFDIFRSGYPAIPMDHLTKLNDKYNFGACNFEDYIHIASKLLKQDSKNNDIQILKTYINLDTAFKNYTTVGNFDDYFKNLWIGVYNNNLRMNRYRLLNWLNIQFNSNPNSLIFVYTTLYEYDMIKDGENHYVPDTSHAVTMMFLPISKGKYKAIYFNPHGNRIFNYTCFRSYHTRMRSNDCAIGESIDMFVMDHLFKFLNNCIPNIEISYEKTEKYNYLGANLQACDDLGICYIFPFYLFHELCYHFREQHILRDEPYEYERRFVSYYSLLKKGNIDAVIYIIISKLITNFKIVFMSNLYYSSTSIYLHENMIKDVEELFSSNKDYYTHRLLYPGIGYLMQQKIKDIIVP